MGVILFIALIFWAIVKLGTDASYISEHNRKTKEFNKQFEANRWAAAREQAKKWDYGLSSQGQLQLTQYNDGSCRYVPTSAGGDGNMRAEKGKYFEH